MIEIDKLHSIITQYSPYFKVDFSIDELTMSPLIIFKLLNSDLVYRYKYSVTNLDKIDELRKQIDADLSSIIRDINIDKIIK
jgi:hypothetical protein